MPDPASGQVGKDLLPNDHSRPLHGVRLGLLQQGPNHPRDIPFAEQQKVDVRGQRRLVGPAEVQLGGPRETNAVTRSPTPNASAISSPARLMKTVNTAMLKKNVNTTATGAVDISRTTPGLRRLRRSARAANEPLESRTSTLVAYTH